MNEVSLKLALTMTEYVLIWQWDNHHIVNLPISPA